MRTKYPNRWARREMSEAAGNKRVPWICPRCKAIVACLTYAIRSHYKKVHSKHSEEWYDAWLAGKQERADSVSVMDKYEAGELELSDNVKAMLEKKNNV